VCVHACAGVTICGGLTTNGASYGRTERDERGGGVEKARGRARKEKKSDGNGDVANFRATSYQKSDA